MIPNQIRHGVGLAVAGKAASQRRRERDAVHPAGACNRSRDFTARHVDDIDARPAAPTMQIRNAWN